MKRQTLSRWALDNPLISALIFVVSLAVGAGAYSTMAIQDFPDIELPAATVVVGLPGASAEQVETEVARKIEDALASANGIERITTTVVEGASTTVAEFRVETSSAEAAEEAREAVSRARSLLPGSATDPVVSKVAVSGAALASFWIETDGTPEDEEAVSWMVDDLISKRLAGIRGVAKTVRFGGVDRVVLVQADPEKLAARLSTVKELAAALASTAQNFASGSDAQGWRSSAKTASAAATADELASREVALGSGGRARLSEVALVRDSIAPRSMKAEAGGRPAVGFEVFRSKGADEPAVVEAVRLALDKIADDTGRKISKIQSRSDYTLENHRASMSLIFEGALLAVFVVWIFLRDWRATLVSAAALPFSLAPAFAAMAWAGYTLNGITLLALSLVVGALVDDAIVEIENIKRHLAENPGLGALDAVRKATDEIGTAVVATTLTIVAVFLPTAFMPGIAGKVFRQFGMTASIAVLASLLVARALTPPLAAWALSKGDASRRASAAQPSAPFAAASSRFKALLERALASPKTTLAFGGAFLAASLGCSAFLPSGFIPSHDRSYFEILLEASPGTPPDETARLARPVAEKIAALPGVAQTLIAVGSGSSGSMGSSASGAARNARLMVVLSERSGRPPQTEIERLARAAAAQTAAGLRLRASGSEAGKKLQTRFQGDDPKALEAAADAAAERLRKIPGLASVTTGSALVSPEWRVEIDYDKAAKLQVSPQAVADALRIALGGDFERALPKVQAGARLVPARVEALPPPGGWDELTLGALRVRSASGLVPISEVALVARKVSATSVDRVDRQRSVVLEADLDGIELGAALKAASATPEFASPPDGVRRVESGEAERMKELFSSFGSALAAGVACVYVILVALTGKLLRPLAAMAALPLSVGGAVAALAAFGHPFSMPSLIGILMLMGVAAKNSILLVEMASELVDAGSDPVDAARTAALKRARPIVMTSFAMAAGMLPAALGLGADPAFRAPMAIAVLGGLVSSTALSLIMAPAAFVMIERRRRPLSSRIVDTDGADPAPIDPKIH